MRRGISSHSCDDNYDYDHDDDHDHDHDHDHDDDDHDDDGHNQVDDVGHDNYSVTADTSHHIREDRSHNACDAEGWCSLFTLMFTVQNDVDGKNHHDNATNYDDGFIGIGLHDLMEMKERDGECPF